MPIPHKRPVARLCLAFLGLAALACSGRGQAASREQPAVRLITSFEKDPPPFNNGTVVTEHATAGNRALRLDHDWADMSRPQDWRGYDYLQADIFAAPPPGGKQVMKLYVEIRDRKTSGYWTRVNHNTVLRRGSNRFILPLAQLFVGEKSRPGRRLLLGGITRLVFSIGKQPGSIFIDNLRLVRDTETARHLFPGLHAFDLGTETSPLMPGFCRIAKATAYDPGRGYGLKDARVWRSYDVLQPDPLYQDFVCIERGGLSVDLPNGVYHVFINLDNPSGYWGEYQKYHERAVLAEGEVKVRERMTLESFKRRYFRFWDQEDSPAENTFDKYQGAYYREHEFDVEVKDGRLDLAFQGRNWACSVSAVVVYPKAEEQRGRAFLAYTRKRRRFFFDNYFRRVLHQPPASTFKPTAADRARGYALFTRDYMREVYYNDTPAPGEPCTRVRGAGFAGELEPLTFSIYPLQDLGEVRVRVSDLAGPQAIPAAAVRVGFVSNRVSRVTMDGAVYTIKPRLVMPRDRVVISRGVTRRFWLTLQPPAGARPGSYRGSIQVLSARGKPATLELAYRVYAGKLAALDVPAGPWGHTIGLPWFGDDPDIRKWNRRMERKSLQRLRAYGFTSCSGLPILRYQGCKDGKPVIDFARADEQMRLAREAGFVMPVVSYCPFYGLNLYYRDLAAMRKAGVKDYAAFVKTVFSAVQAHARSAGWLPVYYNLGDEPIGDALKRAIANAEAYRQAFAKGPPWFTAATSFTSGKADDPHFALARLLTVADFNAHNESSVRLLQQHGGAWAFYNSGSRWTFGTYMYKAVKEFGMKFRLSWHWNVVAGDPYYALDCREDDYAWCNASPTGELIPSLVFERIREGIDDYRYLLTLQRLAERKQDTAALELIAGRLRAFKLGQRDHDRLLGVADYSAFRAKFGAAIERLAGKLPAPH